MGWDWGAAASATANWLGGGANYLQGALTSAGNTVKGAVGGIGQAATGAGNALNPNSPQNQKAWLTYAAVGAGLLILILVIVLVARKRK